MTRYVFDKVTFTAVKSVPCIGCGKRIRRQHTFWMTSNPFNGWPSESELRARMRAKAEAWQAEPERHAACALLGSAR